jgi:dTDP-glucose 4,6-dehydratase
VSSVNDTLLVTGGTGLIGGNFVLDLVGAGDHKVINLDTFTYAGNLDTIVAFVTHTLARSLV